ncbi:MAG TPA: plasmid replication protein, CyRepA1 family [Usitatibacter sp.]|nr:plasmid replication protein, CyRepA1 family [Usitatibacter sp.]
MKLAVLEKAPGEESRWLNFDHVEPSDLADVWASGAAVSAQHGVKTKANGSGFGPTDAVMVRVQLVHLPLSVALDAVFTQQYGSIAAYTHGVDGGELLLAFELPEPVTDAKKYVRLMAGLETIYRGAVRHVSALDAYGLSSPGDACVLGRRLDDAGVRLLDVLGLETKERRRGEGAYVRSRHTVDRSTVLRLPGGGEAILEQLPPHTRVFCPTHVDQHPRAVVHWYPDGTPGVQCEHCRRTYAAPNTRRGYDFGHFDRVMDQLAAQKRTVMVDGMEFDESDATILHERYLSPLSLEEGVTFVKSPKGTNKTGALEALVAECKRQHIPVLLIGHRRALLQSAADRLELNCYFVSEYDEDLTKSAPPVTTEPESEFVDSAPQLKLTSGEGHPSDAATYRRVAPKKRYAISLDSLPELDPSDEDHQYPVVIIDEAEQVFTHLIGETVKARRREVFAKLVHYLRIAKQVVLLDADLNMITMEAAFEIFKPETSVRLLINRPVIKRGEMKLYGSRGELAQVLTDRVRESKKIYVATNSKKKAYELEKLIRVNAPEARLAVVTADNMQTGEVQRLLSDIVARFERELDILVASPAIGTGIDITFKDERGQPRVVVDCVFGFFEGNIVTHFDIDQQLMRVRDPGEVLVWVDRRPLIYETDVTCIKRELEKSVRQTEYLLGYEDDGRAIFSDDRGLVNIWARVLAASRGSKNRLADLLTALREESGWTLVHVDHDADAAGAGRDKLEAAKESRLKEREARLLAADQISPDDAKALQLRSDRGAALTEDERHSLERYRIEAFYAEEISEELIRFDCEGHTRQALIRLEGLTSNVTWFENKDDDERNTVPFDRRRHLVQRSLLENVFVAAELFDVDTRQFKTNVKVAAEDLAQFLQAVEANARQIESLFGIPLYADRWHKPVHQLKGLLALVGLDLDLAERVQHQGKNTRRYAIPAELLDDMSQIVADRDARFKRDEVERYQRQEIGRAKEIRAALTQAKRDR